MGAPLRRPTKDLPDLQSALTASGVVGTWLYHVPTGRIAVSAGVAHRLGLRPERTEGGLDLSAFVEALPRADRSRVTAAFEAAAECGGLLDLTLRSRDGATGVNLRGQIARDGRGRPHQGCGIALATASELDEDRRPQTVLNRMAEHAIALRDLSGELREPGLLAAVEDLMVEIGVELARQLQAGRAEWPH